MGTCELVVSQGEVCVTWGPPHWQLVSEVSAIMWD